MTPAERAPPSTSAGWPFVGGRSRWGKVITFSGIDCAGKSTQIALLQQALERSGARAVVFWLRPGYSKLLDAIRRAVRTVRPVALPTTRDAAKREAAFRRRSVRVAWATLGLLDALFHYGVFVRLARARGVVVLCDRYVEDALLDLDLRFPDLQVGRWRLAGVLRRVSPRPDASILLTLSHGEMLRRMARKHEPYPDAPEVRDARHRRYSELAADGRFVEIDGGEGVDAVQRAIARTVGIAAGDG